MRVDIVTIFPRYFGPVPAEGAADGVGPLGVSLIGKAAARGDIDFRVHDLRRWATDVHHTVDDTPFGGGPGMVMKPDVWGAALDQVLSDAAQTPGGPARLVVPTPSGVPFTQDLAAVYSTERHLVFACGRYEGIDARVVADADLVHPHARPGIGDHPRVVPLIPAAGEHQMPLRRVSSGKILGKRHPTGRRHHKPRRPPWRLRSVG